MSIPQAGVTPAVFFVPVIYTTPGEAVGILADAIDVQTGEYLSIERGFDPTDSAVLTAVRTVRASGSAVENVGQRYADHKFVDNKVETFMREETRLTLKHLVDGGEIEIKRVEVTPGDDSVETYVEWFNIARAKALGTSLPANLLVGRAP